MPRTWGAAIGWCVKVNFEIEGQGDYCTVTKWAPFGGRVRYVAPGKGPGDEGRVTVRTRSDGEENTFPFLSDRIVEWVRPGTEGDGWSDEGSGVDDDDDADDAGDADQQAPERRVSAEEAEA